MAFGELRTKTLDPGEVARLRALLADNPTIEPSPDALSKYPRMVYRAGYLEVVQEWRGEVDELKKKKLFEQRKALEFIVFDAEEEEQFLLDGWKRSPADFMDATRDPRLPVGREARKAAAQRAYSKEEEIQQLRLRLAELTGRVAEAAPVVVDTLQADTIIPTKRRGRPRKKLIVTQRRSPIAAARAAAETPQS